MLQKFRSLLKNEKGLTLIELLAVVVILGIIAAIAVPSIGKIIENTRVDAHIANAQQVVNSARLAATSESSLSVGDKFVTLEYLMENGFIEQIQDPDKKSQTYTTDANKTLALTVALTAAPSTSYVKLKDGRPVEVKLFGEDKKVVATTTSGNLTINSSSVSPN